MIKDPTREPIIDKSEKEHVEMEKVEVEDVELEDIMVKSNIDRKELEEKDATPPSKPIVNPYVQPLPFPNRLKAHKDEEQFKKFLDIFKKLHINIPFVEALAQMPTYLKFMKDLLSKKRKIEDKAIVALTEECSAIIQNKIPQKLKDPGSFSIPTQIGTLHFNKVLCDLGASINLLPLSIFRKLGLGKVKPTNMTLQLADRSVKYPYGIVEDVLVKVDKFYFPVDFVVLDMDEDKEMPLILGRPFLATSKALIDMEEGKMIFRVGDDQVTFHVLRSIENMGEPEKGRTELATSDNREVDGGKLRKDRNCGRFDPRKDTEPN